MKWLRNGTVVKFWSSCTTLIHHLENVDYEDQAEYACEVELENGTVIGPLIAGGMPLNVVGKCSVVCMWVGWVWVRGMWVCGIWVHGVCGREWVWVVVFGCGCVCLGAWCGCV